MEQQHHITFGPFRLDTVEACLWRGAQRITLRPKAVAVLRYLAEHLGRLVTKEELLQHVWPGTHVTSNVLRVCVREIRLALDDQVQAPQYIETVGQRGYRFLGGRPADMLPAIGGDMPRGPGPIVGRQEEIAHLQRALGHAADGRPQLVCIGGDAGIGKTTLLELFVGRTAAQGRVRIGHGQCIERSGEGEPYLPLLEALGRLCREPGGERMRAVLRQYAPTWLVQMPGLLSDLELETFQRRVQGLTQARMLRELAEALHVLTADTPLILILEDLHWGDESTLVWLAYMAQRRDPTRLLTLVTYRPEELAPGHALRRILQGLKGRGQCEEVTLAPLSERDVAGFLAGRLGQGQVPGELVQALCQFSSGHALFLVTMVEHLLLHGHLVYTEGQWGMPAGLTSLAAMLPERLEQLILRQVEALSPDEQRALAGASVAGVTFPVVLVAAGMQQTEEKVDTFCERLAHRGYVLVRDGLEEWPDDTLHNRYRFRHALYRQVLYTRLGEAQRVEIHRRIGERLEKGYGQQARSRANELAMHYEAGRELARAVWYRLQAAEVARQRYAYQELLEHCTAGVQCLATLPETPEHVQHACALQYYLGLGMVGTKGFGAPEVVHAFRRVWEMGLRVWEGPHSFSSFFTILTVFMVRGELQTARDLGTQLLTWARDINAPMPLAFAHLGLGYVMTMQGDLVPARHHLEQSLARSAAPPTSHGLLPGQVPHVRALVTLSWVLWWLGYPQQALQRSQQALALAQEHADPFSLVHARLYLAGVHLFRHEAPQAQVHAEAALALVHAYGFPRPEMLAMVLHGAALTVQHREADGIALLRQGLALPRATPADPTRPYWLALLATAQGRLGHAPEALHGLEEALSLVNTTGASCWHAELLRLKGTVLLRLSRPDTGRTERCFQQAMALAYQQQAKSWELRAAVSLARLWQQQGKTTEARQLLAEVYGWFTEGFDTSDLQEAKALLKELT
jgi:tetratricopeptide (TPR) repeat protein